MLFFDDVTLIRARAVAHVGVCAASFDEPEFTAALLGCGHGHLLSLQDHAGRLLLLPEPRWRYEIRHGDHIQVFHKDFGEFYDACTAAQPLRGRRTLVLSFYSHVCGGEVSI